MHGRQNTKSEIYLQIVPYSKKLRFCYYKRSHLIISWLLKLRNERSRLRVLDNWVLRGIYGTWRNGEWRRLHNEELNDLYCSHNIVRVIKWRRMRWPGHVACMGEERGVYRVLVGKQDGKRPLGRPRRRWVDNIRLDLDKVGCGYMD